MAAQIKTGSGAIVELERTSLYTGGYDKNKVYTPDLYTQLSTGFKLKVRFLNEFSSLLAVLTAPK